MTTSLEHAHHLESMIGALLTHAASKPPADERLEDEEEIGRLGEEFLSQPGAADEIGDIFDRIVGMNAVDRERRIAILEASWENIGPRADE